MRLSDFDYDLPPGLIANHPLPDRTASRMLVVDRATGDLSHRGIADLPAYRQDGDLFVMNDTRVVPARFHSNDGRIELLRIDAVGAHTWRCMVRPGKRMKAGRTVQVGASTGTVTAIDADGYRIIDWDQPVDEAAHGHLALPPYIEREEEPADRERYQTVYAREEGAVAAPTAGLHFTPDLLKQLPHAFLTLHVGPGTFRPVQVDDPAEHRMHEEVFRIGAGTAEAINRATRVIAVGTTTVRVLESVAAASGATGRPELQAVSGSTDIFIHPPYDFRLTNALLTNFHLPKSTLLMLVSAFAGTELVRKAYAEAIRERYRFFSYGDCMLIL
ncbi:MAG: tRNA preQ1(34) S-adenosylmethionine ribosyltransferase-isomerase QueA [Akkermansiaceae bacterium]|nr:tRNA preQ1(34) S-adenosylmethionine ribosyltransferase-isomerase QueA [Akkermansiaceae bacterium]